MSEPSCSARRRAITWISAPAMPKRGRFTSLAEVSGDADCDRPLNFAPR
jgi:hypothetical protein